MTDRQLPLPRRKQWERRIRISIGLALIVIGWFYLSVGYGDLTGNAKAVGKMAAGAGLWYIAELLTKGVWQR